MAKKKIILIGASSRGYFTFGKGILENYADEHEFAAMFDIDIRRCRTANKHGGTDIPVYDDFDLMLNEVRPDLAIIASTDYSHVEYIERCLEAGLGFICEKPLCIDAKQCRRIVKARQRYPEAKAVTAHNYRYGPYMLKTKEIIDSGAIGRILSVDFNEYLDRRHGTSYFRRWNRQQENSGGLLVHKASHHFDLINWFCNSRPKTLSAHGGLIRFGAKNSPFPKGDNYGPACHKCAKSEKECQFKTELYGGRDRMWADSNNCQGYTPDLCVYDESIDTFDHIGAGYDLENGIHVSYSLCAHSCLEGDRFAFEGTEGRLEVEELLNTAPGWRDAVYGAEEITGKSIRLIFMDKPIEKINVKTVKGGHGGADILMMNDLFSDNPGKVAPTLEDGIQAVLTGAAANISIAEGRRVDVQALLRGN